MNRKNPTKATTTRALIQLSSCLCGFYWIYRCKRIANADTQNIRITNADGQRYQQNSLLKKVPALKGEVDSSAISD